MHDIIYSLKGEKYSKGDILQHQGNNSSTLYFLQDGVIEIYSEFDG
jgi:CRP-like cAMP-binding protein